ncbi:MAG: hypothetical protein ACPG7U_04110 [Holosporaceae bacterium]
MTKRKNKRYVIGLMLMGCVVIQTGLMGALHAQGNPEAWEEQNTLVQDMRQRLISYAAFFVFSVQKYVTPMQEMLQAQMDEAPLEQAKKLTAQTQESFDTVKKLLYSDNLGGLIAGLQAKLNSDVPQLDVCLTASEQILHSLGGLAEQKHDKVTTAFIGQMQEHITQAHNRLEDEKKLASINEIAASIHQMEKLINAKEPSVEAIQKANTHIQKTIKEALADPLCEKNMRDLCGHIEGIQKSFQPTIDQAVVANAEDNVVQLWKSVGATGQTGARELIAQYKEKYGLVSMETLIVTALCCKQQHKQTVEELLKGWGQLMPGLIAETGVSEEDLQRYITDSSIETLLKRINAESQKEKSALDFVVWRSDIERREACSVAGNKHVSNFVIPEETLSPSAWSMTFGRLKRGSMFSGTDGQADERTSKRGSLRRSLSFSFKQVMSPALSRKNSTNRKL